MNDRAAVSVALVIGYGEVGKAIAAQLAEVGVETVLVDPASGSDEGNAPVKATIPADLGQVDIVLAAVPSSASLSVAREVASRHATLLHVDLSSSSRALMQQCADAFDRRPASFVDGAIMGSIDLAGADVPIILAGPSADDAAEVLARLGFKASALAGSCAGDASGLKLLRSILMKGIEAIAIECYATANRLGLDAALRDNLTDVGLKPFPELLDAMVRTHVVHASRRSHEIAAAIDQARDTGLDLPVSNAVSASYRRTVQRLETAPPPSPVSVTTAVTWLSEGLK